MGFVLEGIGSGARTGHYTKPSSLTCVCCNMCIPIAKRSDAFHLSGGNVVARDCAFKMLPGEIVSGVNSKEELNLKVIKALEEIFCK